MKTISISDLANMKELNGEVEFLYISDHQPGGFMSYCSLYSEFKRISIHLDDKSVLFENESGRLSLHGIKHIMIDEMSNYAYELHFITGNIFNDTHDSDNIILVHFLNRK